MFAIMAGVTQSLCDPSPDDREGDNNQGVLKIKVKRIFEERENNFSAKKGTANKPDG
jgi:hypothetical protein